MKRTESSLHSSLYSATNGAIDTITAPLCALNTYARIAMRRQDEFSSALMVFENYMASPLRLCERLTSPLRRRFLQRRKDAKGAKGGGPAADQTIFVKLIT
jgi:hypothetical protein